MVNKLFAAASAFSIFFTPIGAMAADDGASNLGSVIRGIYSDTGEQISAIVSDDRLSPEQQHAAISNVLKTKHDTAKNSIGNIR